MDREIQCTCRSGMNALFAHACDGDGRTSNELDGGGGGRGAGEERSCDGRKGRGGREEGISGPAADPGASASASDSCGRESSSGSSTSFVILMISLLSACFFC